MKKYLYLILFFLVCVPAIAGTINSYTLKSPPDDADTIAIYDSDDGSTKKIQVGDISGSGGTASGWTDSGSSIYTTTTSDSVAIGTTTPSRPLTVKTTGVNIAQFVSTSASGTGAGTADIQIVSDDGVALSAGDKFATLQFAGSKDVNGAIGSSAGITTYALSDWSLSNYHSRMDFETTNSGSTARSVRMTIANSNVGINSTNPSERLDVLGNVKATAFIGDGSGLTGLTSASGWEDGGTNVYNTDTSDNVGIGTTTPTTKLMVDTTGVNVATFTSRSATGTGPGTADIKFIADDGAAVSAGDKIFTLNISGAKDSSHSIGSGAGITAYALSDWSGSNLESRLDFETTTSGSTSRSQRLTIANANVGIGTVNPTSRLQVVGFGTTTGRAIQVRDSAQAVKFLVQENGNVGISTASPGAALDIFSGSIRAIGIGTTVPQQICRKADGTFGYFDGVWAGICN